MNSKQPTIASSEMTRCPAKDSDGLRCVYHQNHWPWAHQSAGERKFMIIRNTPVWVDLDCCQQLTAEGNPCTRSIGHSGAHVFNYGNWMTAQPSTPSDPIGPARCRTRDQDGDQCTLKMYHTGDHIFRYNDPIRCDYTDPSSGDQCLLWGGHGGDHQYGLGRPRGLVAGLEDFKSGNEPDQPAPPKPVKRLVITNTDPLRGIIEMECTPELRTRIDAAGLGTVVRGMALSCTLHLPLKLYNFDQVVAWLESLA